jgi:hypothetical protein
MGILARQNPVGQECPTYGSGFDNALATGSPCKNDPYAAKSSRRYRSAADELTEREFFSMTSDRNRHNRLRAEFWRTLEPGKEQSIHSGIV